MILTFALTACTGGEPPPSSALEVETVLMEVARQEQALGALQLEVGALRGELETLQREVVCRDRFALAMPEPVGTDRHAIPGFSALVGEPVVRAGVSNALRYFSSSSGVYTVSYEIRSSAFREAASWAGHELHHDTYDAWRLRILDVARAELADPGRLVRHYERHKPAILDEIRQSEKGAEVQAFLLEQVLPSAELTAPRRAAATEADQAWRIAQAVPWGDACSELAHADSQAASQRLAEATPNADVTAFLLRREAEGGPELVAAWVQIFDDLARSLEEG